jgi:hypothetical protein
VPANVVGLVIDERIQNRRIYKVNPDGLRELRAQLEQFWTKALATYKVAAEQSEEESS